MPSGLGNAGKSLWSQVCSELPDGALFDEREAAILFAACRQRDDIERLEAAIKMDGAMSTGSQGQPVIHPAIPEARQARLALSRLLGQLEIPDAEEKPRSQASKRGQNAAKARWARERGKADRRSEHG